MTNCGVKSVGDLGLTSDLGSVVLPFGSESPALMPVFVSVALAWFLVNDRIKLLANHFFDKTKANPKILAQSEKLSSDPTTRIAKRAYEIYEKRGSQKDLAAQDWKQAEREILKK